MNIAFDVDGVLTNIEKFQLEVGSRFFQKKYHKDIVNPTGYSIREIFDCTEEQEIEFWEKNMIYYALKYPARIGVSETIMKLIQDNHHIEILTARVKTTEHGVKGSLMRNFLRHWLKVEKINYDKLSFCSEKYSAKEKLSYCLKNHINIIVEDSPDNIHELQKEIKVICYNASYNQNIEESNNIYRVDHFYQIYDVISSFYNKSKFKILKRNEKEKMDHIDLIEYYQKLRKYYIQLSDMKQVSKSEQIYQRYYPILKKGFDFKFPYEIINQDKLPNYNGVIYVANHRDMIDPPLVMSALGNRPVHLLLKAEFLNHPASQFLQSIGCVFVDRGNKDSHIVSEEQLIKIMLMNSNCIIFPEGTRNKTTELLLPFKFGAVLIAQVTGAPIVPIAIKKEFQDYSEKIVLEIGDKIWVGLTDDLEEKNNEIKNSIQDMLLKEKVHTKTL